MKCRRQLLQQKKKRKTSRSGWKQGGVLTTLGDQTFTTEKVTVCSSETVVF